MGLKLAVHPAAFQALAEFLARQVPLKKVRTVPASGWVFGDPSGAAFVLPAVTIGALPGEECRLDGDAGASIFCTRGALKAWRAGVAKIAEGNRLMVFAVATAFAGPLLDLVNEPSGGFNLQGRSRTGKTTLLQAAASVWGAPAGRRSFVRTWDSTPAHLEALLAEVNATLAAMDEAGVADPHRIGGMLYALGGGSGKGRATATGRTRQGASWSVIALSTAELGFADLLASGGHQITPGQAARLVDVPTEILGGHGVFAELHGFAGGGELAESIKRSAMEHHGLAGPAFLKWLVPKVAKDPAWPQAALAPQIAGFLDEFLPAGADGQVRAVARRFALVAIAGELATEAGVTGWELRQAWHAAGETFAAWLQKRGSAEAGEDLAAIDRVRAAIEKNWRHRFALFDLDRSETKSQAETEKRPMPIDRGPVSGLGSLGWRRWTERNESEGGGQWTYFFHTSGWREVLGPLDPVQAARALERHGFLVPGAKHPSRVVKIPAHPSGVRVYAVRGEILAGHDAPEDA